MEATVPPVTSGGRRHHLRAIAASEESAIDLIAQRMRATLVEVEGQREGEAMYSLEWLHDRVLWHLTEPSVHARVVVAESDAGQIVGHGIFRGESRPAGETIGFISTTYVVPEARRGGIATLLLADAESWFRAQGWGRATTWTSATNTPLIQLYERRGYAVVEQAPNDISGTAMIRLERRL